MVSIHYKWHLPHRRIDTNERSMHNSNPTSLHRKEVFFSNEFSLQNNVYTNSQSEVNTNDKPCE